MYKRVVVLLLTVLAAACSTQRGPMLYPNEQLQRVGPGEAQADVRYCEDLAREYSENENKYVEAGKAGLIGGAIGAGTGALAGTIMGESAGRGAGAGAAVGGILGILNEMRQQGEGSPSYRQFVEHCLEKKGYEVTGWR
jgi:hypothetical protein